MRGITLFDLSVTDRSTHGWRYRVATSKRKKKKRITYQSFHEIWFPNKVKKTGNPLWVQQNEWLTINQLGEIGHDDVT